MKLTKKKIFMILLIILLLGLFLKVYRIDFLCLWYDEVNFAETRSKNFFEYIPNYIFYKEGIYNDISSPIFTAYSGKGLHVAMPFSPLTFNLWMRAFGTTETALRSYSAFWSILSIFLIFLIARLLFDDKIALLSAFLFAINPYNIIYSQDATFYTLFFFLVLLS